MIAPLVAATALVTPWSGEVSLPLSATPVRIGIEGHVVSLDAGHAAETRTRVTVAGGRMRFSLPGRPARIVFDGRVRGRAVTGTVRQGALRGTFTLQARRPPDFRSLGLYALADGRTISVVDGGTRGAFDVDGGEARGLFGARSPYAVGSGIGVRDPVAGSARFTPGAVDWNGVKGARVAVRQEEVRFPSGSVTLAGTLHLPPGAGPFRSGFDPLPAIRALRIPALWLWGGTDRHMPTWLSVERLEPVAAEAGRDFTYEVFPGANHFLLPAPRGLNAEGFAAHTLAPGLLATLRDWLRARNIVR